MPRYATWRVATVACHTQSKLCCTEVPEASRQSRPDGKPISTLWLAILGWICLGFLSDWKECDCSDCFPSDYEEEVSLRTYSFQFERNHTNICLSVWLARNRNISTKFMKGSTQLNSFLTIKENEVLQNRVDWKLKNFEIFSRFGRVQNLEYLKIFQMRILCEVRRRNSIARKFTWSLP